MRKSVLLGTIALGFLAAATLASAEKRSIAETPGQIRPLMIGADIPDVTLVTPDYQHVVLREALAKQPTILIYYRGGW